MPVPERRAVKWAEALAAIAVEIEQKQGRRRAEILLRAVGGRMAKDMLGSFDRPFAELEAAINRTLSILDWGWTAIVELKGALTFEHRAPLPFQKRPDQLPLVLEGFYSEILHRLRLDAAMQVRFVGTRGGALMFQFVPPDWVAAGETRTMRDPSIILPSLKPGERMHGTGTDLVPQAAPTRHSQAEVFAALEGLKTAGPTAPEAKRLTIPGPLTAQPAPALALALAPQAHEPIRLQSPESLGFEEPGVMPTAGYEEKAPRPQVSVLTVGALVFIILFVLGVLTSGDMAGGIIDELTSSHVSDSDATGSIEALQSRARNGDTDAQIQLALRLADGRRGGADYAGAARWLRMAAASGVAEAQYDLGVLTERGLGVKKDDVEAAIQYLGAAAQGFAPAQYRIGLAYAEGRGVSQSYPDAVNWFERAARQGVHQAQLNLGALYLRGTGVPQDNVAAYAWFRLAEENGDRDAAEQRATLMARMPADQLDAARRRGDGLIAEIGGGRNNRATPLPTTIDTVIDRSR